MTFINFFKGLLIGIIMAAPVGPLSILCIRRSLVRGHHAGIATALGIALADGFYAFITALGLGAISSFIIDKKEIFYIIGGILLVFLGIRTLTAPPILHSQPLKSKGFFITLIQTMFLTLTNPMTIFTFATIAAFLGFEGYTHDRFQAVLISFGVFCGSALWFLMLSTLVAYYRKQLTPFIVTVNKISGSILIAFGILFIFQALKNVMNLL
jgi:threonine/homoserine/homoserine lactone efflux protein